MNIKRIAIGFGFFFISYVVARLIDARLGVVERVAKLIPGMTK